MSDKEKNSWSAASILKETMAWEKHLTTIYNSAANEANSDKIRTDFLNLLMDEHQLEKDIFSVMMRRGLLQPQQADTEEIAQAHQKYYPST